MELWDELTLSLYVATYFRSFLEGRTFHLFSLTANGVNLMLRNNTFAIMNAVAPRLKCYLQNRECISGQVKDVKRILIVCTKTELEKKKKNPEQNRESRIPVMWTCAIEICLTPL